MAFRGQIRDLYEFGEFRLDATERTLMRGSEIVPLPPKVFDTLLVLVENSGVILAKDELLRTIWPDSFVEESNLAQNISQLRKALCENSSEQRFIETIPKRGYRFVAPVKKAQSAIPEFAAIRQSGTSIFEEDDLSVEGVEIEEGKSHLNRSYLPQNLTPPTPIAPIINKPKKRLHYLLIALASLAIISLIGYVVFRQRQSSGNIAFQKMRINKLTSSGKARWPAISADGKYVAYVQSEGGKRSLWVRQVAATSSVQVLAPADVAFNGVTFSPDGNFVYYVVEEKGKGPGLLFSTLYRVPQLGGTPTKLIEDVDSAVTFSPDGKQIAFVRHYPAKKESAIIVANEDGTGEKKLSVRLMPKTFSPVGPSWSPDGKLIACAVGNKGEHGSLMGVSLVRVADGTEEPLGQQDWDWVGQVVWLKDGNGVAVNAWNRGMATYTDQIWLFSYPGGEVSRVTNDLLSYTNLSAARDTHTLVTMRADRIMHLWIVKEGNSESAIQTNASFSDTYSEMLGLNWLSNDRLVYSSHASGNLDVWMMDADGNNQKQLTTSPNTEISPLATADGRYVVFVSERGGTENIWRVDADGSNARQLTFGRNESTPSITPDGRWVVYTSRSEDEPRLWKVSIDGGKPIQLSNKTLSMPVVSPDGKQIVCYYRDEKLNISLVLLPIEGGEETRTLKLPFPVWGIVKWMPDGKSLAYIRNIDGVSNIWMQPIDGGEPQQLTHFKTDQIFRFAWSPDGKQLACERGMTINDIVMISDFK